VTPLRANEPLGPAVRRLVAAELEAALGLLQPTSAPLDVETVHDVRRALTRVRGLLRLVRSGMEPPVRRAENMALRDATRALAPSRDAAVMIATFDELVARRPPSPVNAAVRGRLVAQLDAASAALDTCHLADELSGVRERVQKWEIDDDTVDVVKAGLAPLYRASRVSHEHARQKPADDRLHELRKTAKHVRTALRSLDSKGAARAAERFDRLVSVLGTHQDYVVLANTVGDDAPVWLAIQLREGQKRARKRAFSRAKRIFDDNPNAFVRRVATTWAK
jgi:CHAD domain-containing protein